MDQTVNNEGFVLASRWSRLWAAIIDSLIAFIFILPVLFYTGLGSRILAKGVITLPEIVMLGVYSWLAYLLCNGYLLHTKGQTIGKNVFNIAIVDLSGKGLGLPKLFLKRSMPVALLGYIPFIGGFVSTINILFIFKKNRRCIHDLIAGTQVISVAVKKELDVND